jgi:hypothetical protein
MADTSSEIFEYVIVATDEATPVFQGVEQAAEDAADGASEKIKKLAEDTAALSKQLASESTWHFQKLERETGTLGRIGDRASALMQSLGNQSKALKEKIEPSAAAISGIAGALGQSSGAMGKFIGASGQLLAAFGAGGPIGVALVGATLAFDAYSASVAKTEEAHKKMLEEMKKTPEVLEKAWDNVNKAKDLALKYQQDAADVGKENWQVELENLTKQQAELEEVAAHKKKMLEIDEQALRIMEKNLGLGLNSVKQAEDLDDWNRQRLETARTGVQVLRTEFEKSSTGAKEVADSIDKISNALVDKAKKEKDLAKKIVVDIELNPPATENVLADITQAINEGTTTEGLREKWNREAEARDAALEKITKSEHDAAMVRAESERTYVSSFKQMQDELNVDHARRMKAMLDREKEFWGTSAEMTAGALGIATSAFQTYVEAKVKGEENAEIRMIASVMRQAGQVLVGKGIELTAEGIKNTATIGGAIVGVPQIAIGATMIASGVGLGAAGAALDASVQPPNAAASTGEKTAEASKTLGADARKNASDTSGAAGQGGITIVYSGISGPSADQGARALVKAQRLATTRGY